MKGRINYLDVMAERPAFHAFDRSKDILDLVEHEVEMRPARESASGEGLDERGFAIVRWPTAVDDFEDAVAVRTIYIAEVEALLRQLTGAAKVVVTPNAVVRWGERSDRVVPAAANRPARFVHTDYTDESALMWRDRMLPPEEAEARRGGRFAIYNIWRTLTPPPLDVALAVCDARSIAPEDLVAADAVADFPDRDAMSFEAGIFRPSAAHRWYHVADIRTDEVLVFKGYDSDPARACRSAHTAFDNRDCPPDAPARRSVDIRAFAFFDGNHLSEEQGS